MLAPTAGSSLIYCSSPNLTTDHNAVMNTVKTVTLSRIMTETLLHMDGK